MRKQIEALEHESDAAALLCQRVLGSILPVSAVAARHAANQPAVQVDRAARRPLEIIDAAEQRCLPGARRADNDHRLALRDIEIDLAQHGLSTECFAQALHAK